MTDAELDAAVGFDTTVDPFAERQTRRDAWDEMNRILDTEGDTPAYRAAFDRWAGMYADGSAKRQGHL